MVPRGGFATKPTWRVQDHLSQKKLITFPVREGNRQNSVFEMELRLTFSPIFRNDAMALVRSQGTILSTMASISSKIVAA